MKKYLIIDNTANMGKEYIDENGQNCMEEQAARFDTRKEAEAFAQALTAGQVQNWEEWADIEEMEEVTVNKQVWTVEESNVFPPCRFAVLDGIDYIAFVPRRADDRQIAEQLARLPELVKALSHILDKAEDLTEIVNACQVQIAKAEGN